MLYGVRLAKQGEFECRPLDSNPGPADPEDRDREREDRYGEVCVNQSRYVQKWLPGTRRPPKPLQPGDYVYVHAHHLSTVKKEFQRRILSKMVRPA
ncbi:hypothetical protein PR048_032581 [Dryococelus australis]|uniref:Uncharacterized protein n=1 Tax=Dryococelus australis TaxID=614101 RepID=A0ABQ9G2M1_9NEOP|nr:hypothetical protein PR048_032581 [Dryococelus australis]